MTEPPLVLEVAWKYKRTQPYDGGRERRWLHTVAKPLCFVAHVEVLEEDRKGILSKIVRKRGTVRRGF